MSNFKIYDSLQKRAEFSQKKQQESLHYEGKNQKFVLFAQKVQGRPWVSQQFCTQDSFLHSKIFYNINIHIQRWYFCIFAPSIIVESRERLNLLNQPSFHALFRTRVSKLFCKRPDRQYFHVWILLQLLNSAVCMHKQTYYYKQT